MKDNIDVALARSSKRMKAVMGVLLGLILVGKPVTYAADERQVVALAEATGAFSGSILIQAYLAFAHAEAAIATDQTHPISSEQLIRHLSAIKIIDVQSEKLRKVFSTDRDFLQFLDRLKEVTIAVRRYGEALLDHVRAPGSSGLATSQRAKEDARQLLLSLLGLPDRRDAIP